MKHLSESNKRILTESISFRKQNVSPQVINMVQKSNHPDICLSQRFRNLQDPLSFIKSDKIQKLRNETHHASMSLHLQMDEISQISKNSNKVILNRQNEQYNFRELNRKKVNNQFLFDDDLNKELRKKKQELRRKLENQKNPLRKNRLREYSLNEVLNSKRQKTFKFKKSKFQQQILKEQSLVTLNYQHIKLLDTPHFDKQCTNVQFYKFLKNSKVQQPKHNVVQKFDLNKIYQINKAASAIRFKLIQKQEYHGQLSHKIFFDLKNNFNFWNQEGRFHGQGLRDQNITQEMIKSKCVDLDLREISMFHVFDFAMKKITLRALKAFKDMKLNDNQKMKEQQQYQQNFQQKYNNLKNEIEILKIKKKSNSITNKKCSDSSAQTMYQLNEKQFDSYFSHDVKIILSKMGQLNKLREKILLEKEQQKKLVIIKNICQDMKQLLLKLLFMVLKGEKFYLKGKNKNNTPLFTFLDLINIENKHQVESYMLQFVYGNLENFEKKTVDSIPKSEIIQIYTEERQKNDRILQILHSE